MVKQVSGGFRRFDHERVRLEFDEPSLTHQSFADACDIRNIMAQYKRTGIVQHLTNATEILGDFTVLLIMILVNCWHVSCLSIMICLVVLVLLMNGLRSFLLTFIRLI